MVKDIMFLPKESYSIYNINWRRNEVSLSLGDGGCLTSAIQPVIVIWAAIQS